MVRRPIQIQVNNYIQLVKPYYKIHFHKSFYNISELVAQINNPDILFMIYVMSQDAQSEKKSALFLFFFP